MHNLKDKTLFKTSFSKKQKFFPLIKQSWDRIYWAFLKLKSKYNHTHFFILLTLSFNKQIVFTTLQKIFMLLLLMKRCKFVFARLFFLYLWNTRKSWDTRWGWATFYLTMRNRTCKRFGIIVLMRLLIALLFVRLLATYWDFSTSLPSL